MSALRFPARSGLVSEILKGGKTGTGDKNRHASRFFFLEVDTKLECEEAKPRPRRIFLELFSRLVPGHPLHHPPHDAHSQPSGQGHE